MKLKSGQNNLEIATTTAKTNNFNAFKVQLFCTWDNKIGSEREREREKEREREREILDFFGAPKNKIHFLKCRSK